MLIVVSAVSLRQKVISLVFVIGTAIALELIELLLSYHPPHSKFEWEDLFDDSIGIMAAMFLATVAALIRKRTQ